MRHRSAIAIVAGLAAGSAGLGSPPVGPEWEEPPLMDAGSLPGSAQPVTGPATMPVTKIKGSLSLGLAIDDLQDMFLVRIAQPAIFQAQVDPADTTLGFDTRLWLFDANGFGLLANDDDPAMAPLSILLPTANDGSGAQVTAPGRYYLAISGAPSDPASVTGPIFDLLSPFELSGPDGPGGSSPISLWPAGGAVGDYGIALQGVEFIECPYDLDGDADVDFNDLLVLLGAWGPCTGCPADFDTSGAVDFADLLTLLGAWGPCGV